MLGLAASVGASPAFAQATPAAGNPRRVDVHHHYISPKYRTALEQAGQGKPSGMPGIPKWSVQSSIDTMDRMGIEHAVISAINGVHFGDDQAARELSRQVNEDGAAAVAAHPKRLGFFATVPLPEVDGALKEASYALDELKADGIVLLSNSRGVYLGDPRYEPLFKELDRRQARVLLHPFDPFCACCTNPTALQPLNYPYPMMEFMFDMTRTVVNMILSGTLERHRNLKVIVPHAGAGGILPVLGERVATVSTFLKLGGAQMDEAKVRQSLKRLYYDLAGWPEPVALSALLQVADPANILYGSDWPYTPEPYAAGLAKTLDTSPQLTASMKNAFMRDNALALFPRFKAGA